MKEISRRELFKGVLSKDTIKQVASAWYGFTQPLQKQAAPPEKESLADKVKKINMKFEKYNINPNGKEG